MHEPKGRTEYIRVMLTGAEKNNLTAKAKNKKMTVGKYVRHIIFGKDKKEND